MNDLRVSESLALPIDTATKTQAIVARKGGGKTYLAKVLAEEFWEAGIQFVMFDMVGVCYGLRSSADGEREGIPVLILGGDHGDRPLPHTSGEAVADFLVSTKASAVLDFSNMSQGQRKNFVTGFCLRLYQLNREPLHLIVDEADVFAPQKPLPDETMMLHAMSQIVLRGRAKGLGMTCLTQRPARLNKDVLTQCETLVIKRLMGPQDIKAVQDWVSTHSDRAETKEILDSVPSLRPEQAWFWSPGAFCELVTVRQARTFDSSKTPEIGASRHEPKAFAEIDMSLLDTALTEAEEGAKANDPKTLKARIADLELQIANGLESGAIEEIEKLRERNTDLEGLLEKEVEDNKRLVEIASGNVAIGNNVRRLLKELSDEIDRIDEIYDIRPGSYSADDFDRARVAPISADAHLATGGVHLPQKTARISPTGSNDGTKVTGPQQRMLNALASFHAIGVHRLSKGNLAVFSDQSPKSSGFRANLSALSAQGLIQYVSGDIELTPSGLAAADQVAAPATLADLHRAWKAKLSQPQGRVLSKLIELYPDGIHRSALATATSQSVTSSGYRANLSKLSGLGLLRYDGPEVKATDLLFPKGLKR